MMLSPSALTNGLLTIAIASLGELTQNVGPPRPVASPVGFGGADVAAHDEPLKWISVASSSEIA